MTEDRFKWPGGRALLALLVLAGAEAIAADAAPAAARQTTTAPAGDSVDRRWLERLDKGERAAIERQIGYAPPAFPGSLTWVCDEHPDGLTWEQLRGKVVVLQSWTTRTAGGRRVVARLDKTLRSIEPDDLFVVLLHTPEGADKAQYVLERKPPKHAVVMDNTGAYCDELGIYKRPVNFVVDRNGAIRYAGLNTRGLTATVAKLVAESPDPGKSAEPRPPIEPEEEATWPPITGTIEHAVDMRGLPGPEIVVERWMTSRPDPHTPIAIVNFWSPSVEVSTRSLVHLTTMAKPLEDSVAVVGVCGESREDFEELIDDIEDETDLRFDDLGCSLAIDRRERMKNAAKVEQIPHTLVMSRDGIVRWQGPPTRLKPDVLERIVLADRAQAGEQMTTKPRKRWADKKR